MSKFILTDSNREREKEFDTKAAAEESRQDLIGLGASPEDLEITAVEAEATDGGQTTQVVQESTQEPPQTAESIPDEPPSVEQDPVDWLPGHFVDTIQGVPTVNRKGYAVIASQFDVSVTSNAVVRASESDFEFAEFEATAVTEDGKEYSGFGSAHIERMDGDDPYLLNELAETRAMKRAVAWATGVGMTAASEMMNEP